MFLLGAIGAGFLAGRVVRSGTAAASEQGQSGHSGEGFATTTPGSGYPTASAAVPAWAVAPLAGRTGSEFATTTAGYPTAAPVVDEPLIPGEPLITPPTVGGVEGVDRLP
jgi:hypothetical protein